MLIAPLTERLSRLSAVFSYYAIFSLAPLLLLTATITGFTFGWEFANRSAPTNLERSADGITPGVSRSPPGLRDPLHPEVLTASVGAHPLDLRVSLASPPVGAIDEPELSAPANTH